MLISVLRKPFRIKLIESGLLKMEEVIKKVLDYKARSATEDRVDMIVLRLIIVKREPTMADIERTTIETTTTVTNGIILSKEVINGAVNARKIIITP